MQVDVHLLGILRDKLPKEAKGRSSLDLQEGVTVSELLTQLEIQQRVVVAVNDEEIEDRSRILNHLDQVTVFMMIGGG